MCSNTALHGMPFLTVSRRTAPDLSNPYHRHAGGPRGGRALAMILSGRTPKLSTSRVHTSALPRKPARTGLNSEEMHASASSAVATPEATCAHEDIRMYLEVSHGVLLYSLYPHRLACPVTCP